jgi:hypothetical protein
MTIDSEILFELWVCVVRNMLWVSCCADIEMCAYLGSWTLVGWNYVCRCVFYNGYMLMWDLVNTLNMWCCEIKYCIVINMWDWNYVVLIQKCCESYWDKNLERKTIDIFEIEITEKIGITIPSTRLGQRGEKLVVKCLKVKIILA